MVLASPLVCERVWLDKPKYDAAERRYYERLAQSLATSKGVAISTDSKSSEVPIEQEVIDDDICVIPQAQPNEPLKTLPDTCAIKPKESVEENVCKRPTEGSVCKKPNKTTQEKSVNKPAKEDESSICPIPSKEKNLKNSNEMPEPVCQKPKAVIKHEKTSKKNVVSSAADNVDSISEVLKQKGFDLHLKPLIPLPDTSLTKGTNVNTIPELTNLSSNPDKSKTSNQVKKLNQLNRVPTLDKQESTDLIIPTSIITTTTEAVPVDDQAKKDSKKKKKNKKDRHRDNKKGVTQNTNSWNSLAGEVAKARQHIKNSLQCIDDIAVTSNTVSIEVANRVVSLEKENQELTGRMEKLEARIAALEKQLQQAVSAAAAVTTSAPGPAKKEQSAASKPPAKQSNDDDDDGVDLFASDSEEEDAEAARIKEQRLAEYAAKKSKKPALIAKSSIILDVKPWDDETDMKKMEEEVRKIATDGLLWGASKLVPLAYGIHKLQINCVVEDEKVSIDWLQETIQEIEDYVQSVDIAAFNKI